MGWILTKGNDNLTGAFPLSVGIEGVVVSPLILVRPRPYRSRTRRFEYTREICTSSKPRRTSGAECSSKVKYEREDRDMDAAYPYHLS